MSQPNPPLISVVVSTYEKPQALQTALRSLLAQTCADWKAVVIGDACGPYTAARVMECADPRIHYLNLPDRCGEQSGPNSLGLSLALGRYVAFLNHDDVLLPDHFEHLLTLANEQHADFVLGRAARATTLVPLSDGGVRPGFTWVRGVDMTPAMGFSRALMLIEPSSAWLVRREAAQRVGPWRLSITLRRQPITDWFLRAWSRGLRIRFAERITCLKNAIPGDTPSWQDRGNGPEHTWLRAVALRGSPDETRALIAADLTARSVERPERWALSEQYLRTASARCWHRLLLNPVTAALFRLTGWDAMAPLQWILGMGVGVQGRDLAYERSRHVPQAVGNPSA